MSAAESVFAAIRKHREQYGHWIGQCGGVHGFNYSHPGHYLLHGDKLLQYLLCQQPFNSGGVHQVWMRYLVMMLIPETHNEVRRWPNLGSTILAPQLTPEISSVYIF